MKALTILLAAAVRKIHAVGTQASCLCGLLRSASSGRMPAGGTARKAVFLFALAATCLAQDEADPTKASPRMKAAMMAGGAIPEMTVKGLVLSAAREGGTVMFEITGGSRVLARPGVAFTAVADGEARKLVIKRISSDGIEIEAPAQKETAIIPSFGPTSIERSGVPGEVDYAEFRDLPLLDALRMLSDQTGNNYSASVEANKISVNAMLRGVSANSIVEEICKSHGLWFKRDETSGILRIMTVGEFEKDLVGFREEQTEVFTLKFPNVHEVASAIADLFGDRVQLSRSEEERDEDARRDLEGRFNRFDVLTQRAQSANSINGTILGNNVNGVISNGGSAYGIGGFNSSSRNDDSYNRSRNDRRRTGEQSIQADDELFRNLTPEQAQRVDRALTVERQGGNAAREVEGLRRRPATIFVTASRRNNMVVVRTADARALADIRALVTRMDVQTPLVLLEVKVVSIELGKDFRSAFDYQFSDGGTSSSFSRENISLPLSGGAIGGVGLNSSDMTFTVVSNNFRARMQLFEEKNRVKTLASPILLTANNEISRLFLGEERPLVRGINSQTIITDNNVATTPNTTTEFRNVGSTLLITPNINSDRTVTLRLVQENSAITANGATIPVVTSSGNSSSVQNVKVDTVATRSISGTFVAKDGMAVAAGGLIEDVDSSKRGQIPVLGNIPGLGFLFRRQTDSKSRKEMVVIIRPYVMSTPADGERISKDLLRQLAPNAVERLAEKGLLTWDSVIPKAKPVARAAAPTPDSKKVQRSR
jgi:general secretion pathway protein D